MPHKIFCACRLAVGGSTFRNPEGEPISPDDEAVWVDDEEVGDVRVGLEGRVQHHGAHPAERTWSGLNMSFETSFEKDK